MKGRLCKCVSRTLPPHHAVKISGIFENAGGFYKLGFRVRIISLPSVANLFDRYRCGTHLRFSSGTLQGKIAIGTRLKKQVPQQNSKKPVKDMF